MASVGGVTCDLVSRDPGPSGLKERVHVYQSPGYDGYNAQKLGLGEAAFRFRAVKYGTSAAINTWIEDIEGKQGSIVTVIDDYGDSHTNLLIKRTWIPRKEAAIQPGSDDDSRGEVVIEGVRMQ